MNVCYRIYLIFNVPNRSCCFPSNFFSVFHSCVSPVITFVMKTCICIMHAMIFWRRKAYPCWCLIAHIKCNFSRIFYFHFHTILSSKWEGKLFLCALHVCVVGVYLLIIRYMMCMLCSAIILSSCSFTCKPKLSLLASKCRFSVF